MTRTEKKEMYLAIHEAAHAVVSYVLGCGVPTNLDLYEDGTGSCGVDMSDKKKSLEYLQVLSAGYLAERIAGRRQAGIFQGSDGDIQMIGGIAKQYNMVITYPQFERKARVIIKKYWDVICSVADILNFNRHLDQQQVGFAITNAMDAQGI